MKKLLVLIASVISLTAADLGVLYNDTNNLISPASLGISNFAVNTNLSLPGQIPNRALSLDNNSNVVSSSLSSLQQGYLASMIGNTNILYLGGTPVFSGTGNPTNGVVFTNISFYINSTAADISHTFYFSFGTNWLSLYSTNGGSIVESQLNFSDVTTANATTNLHGLLPKLDGITTHFLDGTAHLVNPLTATLNTIANGIIPQVSNTGPGAEGLIGTGLQISGLTSRTLTMTGDGSSVRKGLIQTDAFHATNLVTIDSLPVNQIVRSDGSKNLTNAIIGAGLSWDGVTLSTAGVGGGNVNTTGSPLVNQVSYFTDPTHITGNAGFTFDGTTLFVTQAQAGSGVFNQITVSYTSTNGNIYSGRYTPTRTPINNASISGTVSLDQHFIRVGNQVTVSGVIYMARLSSGLVNFSITLPTPTEIVNPSTLNGFGVVFDGSDLFQVGQVVIYADASYPNQAVFKSVGSSTSGTLRAFRYSFTYNTN